jgi:hypothetical protein
MANQRGYDEDEVEEIFDLAVQGDRPGRRGVASDRGLTLPEIQEIGREAGIEPDRIAEAAAVVAARRQVRPPQKSLGVPVSVGRIVPLPRALTDREWELFVVELRETFGARGRVASYGGLREWSNGNLHAVVEPVEAGYRLRLGTLKSGAVAMGWSGVVGVATALVTFPLSVATGLDLTIPIFSAAWGFAALASNRIQLPRWALERERQMEYLAGRVGSLVGARPRDGESGT